MSAASPTPSISAVVATYNRRQRLPALVDALTADAVSEAVFVIDGARDGSLEYLQSRAEADPRVIAVFVEHGGEGAARAAGVERASGDVVLLLDDDVVPTPGLAAGHARRHAGEQGLVVLGYMPVATPPEQRTATQDLYARAYERVCSGYEDDPATILDGLWAGNMSLRRDDCRRVFSAANTSVRGYHADRDFGLRCRRAGLRGVFDRTLLAHHHYERGVEAFARDAYSSGYSRRVVHELYPETGPLPGDFYMRGLPAPGRWFVGLAARPRGRAPAQALLDASRRIAASAGLGRVESHVTHVLATTHAQHGAIDAAHGRAGAPR